MYTQEEKMQIIESQIPLFYHLMRHRGIPPSEYDDCLQELVIVTLLSLKNWDSRFPLSNYIWKPLNTRITWFKTRFYRNKEMEVNLLNQSSHEKVDPYLQPKIDEFFDFLNYNQEKIISNRVLDLNPKILKDLAKELGITDSQLRTEINNYLKLKNIFF